MNFIHLRSALAAAGCSVILLSSAFAQMNPSATIRVDAADPLHAISPNLYGIFFEEINCAGDGGLYAELIRNRSFEESDTPVHWRLIKEGMVDAEMGIDSLYSLGEFNKHYLKVKVLLALEGFIGVANDGYWGIPIRRGATYDFSLRAMALDGINTSLVVTLQSPDDRVLAKASIGALKGDWDRFLAALTANDSCSDARLVIRISQPGMVFLDNVSLFPRKTFMDRPNGLRVDLAEMLQGLHPSFVRFPGGCWVEGDNLNTSYRWKRTIGDVDERWYQYNIWQYYSTNGLGFHEYLQMCEDLGAEPLFVINCGMSHHGFAPIEDMGPWVQDALDAIEYANGSVDTRWGGLRAKHGHPEPFHLKYMEIGNENGGPVYADRYALFYDAIKAKYPSMHLIADVWGGYPKTHPVEMIDEHYYSSSRFFIENADRYDSYDRSGPKIYVGEYAVTQGCGNGNLRAAVAEAAFMTGLERNSDIVTMSSYAPLFANLNYKKWNPDLINFNGVAVYGTPSYYVQQMFSRNVGNVVLKSDVETDVLPPEPPKPHNGMIGVGTWNTQAEYKDIRVTKNRKTLYASDFETDAKGWTPRGGTWKIVDGALRQSEGGSNRQAVFGDTSWNNYTYSLKARKLSGAEGFLILFSVQSQNKWVWWNVGGWGNTQTALEYSDDGGKAVLGEGTPGSVETGRWYDIRIELAGERVKCYLDGKLIQEGTFTLPPLKPLHVAASRVTATGEIILKVVNVSGAAFDTKVDLAGVKGIVPTAAASVLRSSDPEDENSIAAPFKVAPHEMKIENVASEFHHVFPANSVTVLRIKSHL